MKQKYGSQEENELEQTDMVDSVDSAGLCYITVGYCYYCRNFFNLMIEIVYYVNTVLNRW